MAGVRLPTHNTLKTTTMTKENFITKWAFKYNVNYTTNPYFIDDLEAVIATEIEKVQIEKTKETRKIEISDYTLVEICRAFRALRKDKNSYIHHVFSDDYVFHAMNEIEKAYENYFGKKPEQITTDQMTDQVQHAKPFDKDRFEAMFRAVIETHEATMNALKQLDAYYASKEGGNNE